MTVDQQLTARKLTMSGVVQGVGFRPFIYRHAKLHGLNGWVRNASGRVEAHIQGDVQSIENFLDTLLESAPGLSCPVIESVTAAETLETGQFLILESCANGDADIRLPADLFTCDECLEELNDPQNRRYRYPFINCTQCGPRYTLIEALPYDRKNTSMSCFPLCDSCLVEYTDPMDRRYHAEPIACEDCGPRLSYNEPGKPGIDENEAALAASLAALHAGKILAIKGIGGYHLICDARNNDTVGRLRVAKPRPDKPLAVMFPVLPDDNLTFVRQYLAPSELEADLLSSNTRPIVLIEKNPDNELAADIAPGLKEIGAMLPYSPLHHLLLADFSGPLVATSANISGEPVLIKNGEVERRLSHVADAFLHHNRPIVRPADDPVIRVIDQSPALIRQGRGMAPVEIPLPFEIDRPVLAVGAHMKNTIALAWSDRVVVSPHIGEMDSPRSLQTFEQCINDLQELYQVKVEKIVCDAHPGFAPSRWAHQQNLPVSRVYHHHAHASAAFADALRSNEQLEQILVFTWDGVGLGPDGTLWGGEALCGRPGNWQRRATFRSFRLPGGERAGREPWRSAAALCWEGGRDCPLEEASDPLLFSFWQQGKNAPSSTAVGRLFDAASALIGVCTRASFEGQGPMHLETEASKTHDVNKAGFTGLNLSRVDGCYTADWEALIPVLMDTRLPVSYRAAHFHGSMAHSLLNQAEKIREDTSINKVALSGGVFQNRLLTSQVIGLLKSKAFEVTLPMLVPVNDAGISFGQIIESGYKG